MPEPIEVPDLAEALVGRRCWGLAKTDEGIRLLSRGDSIWPADEPLNAVCDLGKKHNPPAAKCTCGIYALSTEEAYPYYGYDGRTYAVFGETYLWGEVICGSRGFRAQYGYPKLLYIAYKDWKYAGPLQDAYRVPVRLTNPYNTQGH